jgi:membrane protein
MRVVLDVVRSAVDDNITGEAAKAAFYFFLSLFPLILLIFAVTGYYGGDAAFNWIMGWLHRQLPEGAETWVSGSVAQITQHGRPDMLSVGLLLAVWAGSNFFAGLGDALNAMYDIKHPAPWWKRRLKSILLLVVGLGLLIGGALLILFGPLLVDALGFGEATALVRWPLVLALITGLLYLVYYVMPDRDQRNSKRAVLIGAVTGAVLWLLAVGAFQLYVSRVANYGNLYGVVGSVLVLLLWLYISAIAILLGGETAGALER